MIGDVADTTESELRTKYNAQSSFGHDSEDKHIVDGREE